MLFVYVGVSVWSRPPTPVAFAVHGVSGEPVYVVGVLGQVTAVTDAALLITKLELLLLASWFASPANDASAVAVPAFVLLV